MSKGKTRGKRYETAFRVGSLANLALVGARSPRAIEARVTVQSPAPTRAGEGGSVTWPSTWR